MHPGTLAGEPLRAEDVKDAASELGPVGKAIAAHAAAVFDPAVPARPGSALDPVPADSAARKAWAKRSLAAFAAAYFSHY
jgi:hypothetical protein